MGLIQTAECSASDCDFKRLLGDAGHRLYDWAGYCRHCLTSVKLRELKKGESGYRPGFLAYRVLKPNPAYVAPPKRLKPSERRARRRAPQDRPGGAPNDEPAQPEFLETSSSFYLEEAGSLVDGGQGVCPECGCHDAVLLWLEVAQTPCPKCGTGGLHDSTANMDITILRDRRRT